jgi:glutathionylspermidine synthase
MLRYEIDPRVDWEKTVESQGLLFHSIDDEPYWDESAFYLFEAKEVDEIERATAALDALCLKAVEHVIENQLFALFGIPHEYTDWITRSWEQDEHTIYGRFDLAFDGQGTPKLLEYNADTPTALLEAAVIQWYWLKDRLALVSPVDRNQFDQLNSIHERLIEAWASVKSDFGDIAYFSAVSDSLEDQMTVHYLRDTATQAGFSTRFLTMPQIGWHERRGTFTDLKETAIGLMFKLYPWEWMIREQFGKHLPRSATRWLEPPWKMILSNKAILPILWELFPENPYLLKASFEPFGDTYVVKPTLSREGANVTIVENGQVLAETMGDYSESPKIFQAYHPLPDFEGKSTVIGSWIVNGYPCGIGLREDDGPITRNSSRFIPHLFRKSSYIEPPGFS